MITIASDYGKYLENIQNNTAIMDEIVPGVPELIEIDLNSRTITLPSAFKDFLSVETDHYSETVYFIVDRYFDDIDLSKKTIVIEYINAAGESRIFPVCWRDTKTYKDDNKMLFAWSLSGDATRAAGQIQFAVKFYSLEYNKELAQYYYTYNLATQVCTGNILHGIENAEAIEDQYGYTDDVVKELFDRINDAEQSKLSWIDVE